jgi:hypothetical protein
MKYIDVRLRIPINKMGVLVDALPEWANMVGYDKLEPVERRAYAKRQNGKTQKGVYKPGKGTAAEAVLKALNKPMRRFEIINKLNGKQKEKAVSSAIHSLANKGLLVREGDAYARAH